MIFNVSTSASGSDLPRFLAWRMPLLSVVILCGVITGSGGSTAKNVRVAVLAQRADKRDQNYYANAHPYLEEEPLKKLVKRIPELRGLRPTADQQALPMILAKSGERVDQFFHNVVDLLAHEEIAEERRLNGIGAIWASELVQDSYLILRHGDKRDARIDEYRMDEKGNRMDHVGLDKGFFVTAGFALSCNYFSTAFQDEKSAG